MPVGPPVVEMQSPQTSPEGLSRVQQAEPGTQPSSENANQMAAVRRVPFAGPGFADGVTSLLSCCAASPAACAASP
eukprot:7386560-Prymnesium_polylepis.2